MKNIFKLGAVSLAVSALPFLFAGGMAEANELDVGGGGVLEEITRSESQLPTLSPHLDISVPQQISIPHQNDNDSVPSIPHVMDFLAESINLVGRDVLSNSVSDNNTASHHDKSDASGKDSKGSSDDESEAHEELQAFLKKTAPNARESAIDGAAVGSLAALPGAVLGGGIGAAAGYLIAHILGSRLLAIPVGALAAIPGSLVGALAGGLTGGALAGILSGALLAIPSFALGSPIGGMVTALIGAPIGALLGSLPGGLIGTGVGILIGSLIFSGLGGLLGATVGAVIPWALRVAIGSFFGVIALHLLTIPLRLGLGLLALPVGAIAALALLVIGTPLLAAIGFGLMWLVGVGAIIVLWLTAFAFAWLLTPIGFKWVTVLGWVLLSLLIPIPFTAAAAGFGAFVLALLAIPGFGLLFAIVILPIGWVVYEAMVLLFSLGSWVLAAASSLVGVVFLIVALIALPIAVPWSIFFVLGAFVALFIPFINLVAVPFMLIMAGLPWIPLAIAATFFAFAAYNFIWPIVMFILPSLLGVIIISVASFVIVTTLAIPAAIAGAVAAFFGLQLLLFGGNILGHVIGHSILSGLIGLLLTPLRALLGALLAAPLGLLAAPLGTILGALAGAIAGFFSGLLAGGALGVIGGFSIPVIGAALLAAIPGFLAGLLPGALLGAGIFGFVVGEIAGLLPGVISGIIGAVIGAVIGAALGSLLGVLGAIIGTLIGAIAGSNYGVIATVIIPALRKKAKDNGIDLTLGDPQILKIVATISSVLPYTKRGWTIGFVVGVAGAVLAAVVGAGIGALIGAMPGILTLNLIVAGIGALIGAGIFGVGFGLAALTVMPAIGAIAGTVVGIIKVREKNSVTVSSPKKKEKSSNKKEKSSNKKASQKDYALAA